MSVTRLFHEKRAVSETVSYMLSLSILLIVVSAIGFAGTQHMDEISDQQGSNELNAIGQQVAYEYQFIDQAVQDDSAASSSISRNVNLKERAAGQQYNIRVEHLSSLDGDIYYRYELTLTSGQGAKWTVPIETKTEIRETTIQGGNIIVIRPQPSQANVNTGFCELLDTNGEGGLQSFDEAKDKDYPPDTCKLTMKEAE